MSLNAQARRKRRRFRRHLRRGWMLPDYVTALSTRTRWRWPTTKSITRWHRCERWPKPRYKWAEYEDEKGLRDE